MEITISLFVSGYLRHSAASRKRGLCVRRHIETETRSENPVGWTAASQQWVTFLGPHTWTQSGNIHIYLLQVKCFSQGHSPVVLSDHLFNTPQLCGREPAQGLWNTWENERPKETKSSTILVTALVANITFLIDVIFHCSEAGNEKTSLASEPSSDQSQKRAGETQSSLSCFKRTHTRQSVYSIHYLGIQTHMRSVVFLKSWFIHKWVTIHFSPLTMTHSKSIHSSHS